MTPEVYETARAIISSEHDDMESHVIDMRLTSALTLQVAPALLAQSESAQRRIAGLSNFQTVGSGTQVQFKIYIFGSPNALGSARTPAFASRIRLWSDPRACHSSDRPESHCPWPWLIVSPRRRLPQFSSWH